MEINIAKHDYISPTRYTYSPGVGNKLNFGKGVPAKHSHPDPAHEKTYTVRDCHPVFHTFIR